MFWRLEPGSTGLVSRISGTAGYLESSQQCNSFSRDSLQGIILLHALIRWQKGCQSIPYATRKVLVMILQFQITSPIQMEVWKAIEMHLRVSLAEESSPIAIAVSSWSEMNNSLVNWRCKNDGVEQHNRENDGNRDQPLISSLSLDGRSKFNHSIVCHHPKRVFGWPQVLHPTFIPFLCNGNPCNCNEPAECIPRFPCLSFVTSKMAAIPRSVALEI